MKLIEQYIRALEQCDHTALSELFAPEGTIRDYCPTSTFRAHEYHLRCRNSQRYPSKVLCNHWWLLRYGDCYYPPS